MEGSVHFRHLKHFGFAGCPESGFLRGLLWGGSVDCSSGFFNPLFGGFVRYDFPVTGEGFIAPGDVSGSAYGSTDDSQSEAKSAKRRTLLALEDGSEFALTEYWLEGHELHYVTTYGGRNSLPVERIDLERTVRDNAERGVRFLLRPRPAGTPDPAVTP